MTLEQAVAWCMQDGPFGDSLLIVRREALHGTWGEYVMATQDGKRGKRFSAHWSATAHSLTDFLQHLEMDAFHCFAPDYRCDDWKVMSIAELADWNSKSLKHMEPVSDDTGPSDPRQ